MPDKALLDQFGPEPVGAWAHITNLAFSVTAFLAARRSAS